MKVGSLSPFHGEDKEWADFDFKRFFGGLGPKHVPPQQREFSVNNIEIREKFLNEFHRIMEYHNIPQRIDKLEAKLQIHGRTEGLERQYNALDKKIIEGCKLQ